MGAQQSSAEDARNTIADSSSPRTCYYELLGVDRLATDGEIKKAYRRKALELHPDRNINDVEAATRSFADVQAAYEVLVDPQERVWYDSHRDAILNGLDNFSDGIELTTFRNVHLTTTGEILSLMRRLNTAMPFNNKPEGFFGMVRDTFQHLAVEEDTVANSEGVDFPDYPTFGFSNDSYETVVKSFYKTWAVFSTKKTFSWKDKHCLSDAPDRRVRRRMERENNKSREEAARDFNDAVRFLVSFVRKRDPRYLPNTQTDADRLRSLRVAAAAQAARSRAINKEMVTSYEVPEWARSGYDDLEHIQFEELEEKSEVEILECIVCNKTFKSDRQLGAHEQSKKHKKALYQQSRQMKWEAVKHSLNIATSGSSELLHESQCYMKASPSSSKPTKDYQADVALTPTGTSSDDIKPQGHEKTPGRHVGSTGESTAAQDSNGFESSGDADIHVPRGIVEEPVAHGLRNKPATESAENSLPNDLPSSAQSLFVVDAVPQLKVGKAKAKRLKKADLRALNDEVSIP